MAITGFGSHAFTLRQLQYAAAVAQTLSFRKAAEHCGVSQPALSAQLQQLEQVLGVRLFERSRRRVFPTAAAAALLERARRVLVEADELSAEARQVGDPLTGTLRLGVIPTVSPYFLPRAMPALHVAHPQLVMRWVEDKTATLVAGLAGGSLDAALVALEAELGDVDHEVVGVDPFVLVTRADDPLGKRPAPAKPDELDGADILLLDEGHCFREQALRFCTRAKAHELQFRATSLPTLAQMVAGGAGVTLLPSVAVETEVARADLRVRRFAQPSPRRTVVLAWRRGSWLAPALEKLAKVMRAAWSSAAKGPRR